MWYIIIIIINTLHAHGIEDDVVLGNLWSLCILFKMNNQPVIWTWTMSGGRRPDIGRVRTCDPVLCDPEYYPKTYIYIDIAWLHG